MPGHKIAEAFVEVSARLGPLNDGIRRAQAATLKGTARMQASLSAFATKTQAMSRTARRAFIGLGAVVTATAALFSNFEKRIGLVSTLLGDDFREKTAQFANDIKNLAVKYGESTSTLAAGLFDIISASIPAAEAIHVLEKAAIAAKGSTADTATVVDALTTILNAYKLSASDAASVTDFLAVTAKRGKTDLSRLAPVIGRVASTAKAAGLSLEEMGAAIALFTRAGLSTDEAVTSLNAILQGFLKPMADAQLAAREFGFELNTTTLRTLGLAGVFKKLASANAEQLATMFPNIRALKGVASGFQNAAEFAEDMAAMTNRAGEAQKAFGRASEGMAFQLDRVKQAFAVLMIELGDVIFGFSKGENASEGLANQIRDIAQGLKNLTPEVRAQIRELVKWGVIIVGTTAVLSPMLNVLSKVLAVIVKLGAMGAITIGIALVGAAKVIELIAKIRGFRAEEKRLETEARRTAQTREVNALEFAAEQAGATEDEVKAQRDKAVKSRVKSLWGINEAIAAERQKGYDYLDKKYGAGSQTYRARRESFEQGTNTFEPELELRRKNIEGLRQQDKQLRSALDALQGADIAKIMADTKATRDKATAAEVERLGLTGPDWAPSRDSLGPLVGRAVGPLGPLVGGDVGGGARKLAKSRHPLGPLVGRAVGPLGPLVGGVIGGLPAFFGGGGKAQPRQPRTASVPKPFA
ncbi:MAG TPA: phage tail tape measure protein, partial [Phycisphaerae bacterium]|nr:phage tail tape measure protein [Phycisphaerae bacterium]